MEFHSHITRRMLEHGVSEEEVLFVFEQGWPCGNAHPGRDCRTWVFEFNSQRGRRRYAEKEVTVYFKEVNSDDILLTVKARYGQGFPRGKIE